MISSQGVFCIEIRRKRFVERDLGCGIWGFGGLGFGAFGFKSRAWAEEGALLRAHIWDMAGIFLPRTVGERIFGFIMV